MEILQQNARLPIRSHKVCERGFWSGQGLCSLMKEGPGRRMTTKNDFKVKVGGIGCQSVTLFRQSWVFALLPKLSLCVFMLWSFHRAETVHIAPGDCEGFRGYA